MFTFLLAVNLIIMSWSFALEKNVLDLFPSLTFLITVILGKQGDLNKRLSKLIAHLVIQQLLWRSQVILRCRYFRNEGTFKRLMYGYFNSLILWKSLDWEVSSFMASKCRTKRKMRLLISISHEDANHWTIVLWVELCPP